MFWTGLIVGIVLSMAFALLARYLDTKPKKKMMMWEGREYDYVSENGNYRVDGGHVMVGYGDPLAKDFKASGEE